MLSVAGWGLSLAAYVIGACVTLAAHWAFVIVLEIVAPRPGPRPSLHSRAKADAGAEQATPCGRASTYSRFRR
jgi:hypothetical protein